MTERLRLARCLESFCAYAAGEGTLHTALTATVEYAAHASTVPLRALLLGPHDGVVTTLASTDPEIATLERFDGPHHEAFRRGGTLLVADISRDARWPTFARASTAIGVRSAAAISLANGSSRHGALLLGHDTAAAITPDVLAELVHVVAIATAILAHEHRVLESQRVIASLRGQLNRRVEIEQAKGVIMGTTRCDAERAAALLIEQSQRENRKLFDVASDLVRTAAARADDLR